MNALKTKLATALALTAVLTSNAFAAVSIDTSSVTTDITSVMTAIGVIGAAILGMFVGAKAFKWIRSVL